MLRARAYNLYGFRIYIFAEERESRDIVPVQNPFTYFRNVFFFVSLPADEKKQHDPRAVNPLIHTLTTNGPPPAALSETFCDDLLVPTG